MKTWVLIPARFASTRFPGKPLALIAGVPLLERVIIQAQKASQVERVVIATDHEEIQHLCEKVGVSVVQTDSDLNSGTDRIHQALKRLAAPLQDSDVIINVQGDEPLMPPEWIEGLISLFKREPSLEMATLAHPLGWDELENLNSVKVVCDNNGYALYFSRFPIPHSREKKGDKPISLKHVGVYGYRYGTLKKFCTHAASPLEVSESLEQLRALDMGIRIQVMPVAGASQGVDTPEDVQKVEKLLKG